MILLPPICRKLMSGFFGSEDGPKQEVDVSFSIKSNINKNINNKVYKYSCSQDCACKPWAYF